MKNNFMNIAIDCAVKAGERGEIPVGAVVVHEGEVMAMAGNESEEQKDVSAHAEMLAIKRASKKMNQKILNECDLYVTLEPCPMCAATISAARIRRLYFGAYDSKSGGVEHGSKIFSHSSAHHKPEVYGGIEEKICADLMVNFFKDRR